VPPHPRAHALRIAIAGLLAIVPFAALLTAAGVGAICLLVFLQDVYRNERLSKAGWRHARA
jgi:hypothetical protein